MADEKAVLREIHTLEEEIQSLQDQLEHPESLDTGSIMYVLKFSSVTITSPYLQ